MGRTMAVATVLAALAAAPVNGQDNGLPDPPVVDYTIDVTLDTETKKLNGTQTLVYTNHSPDEIPDLRFHLYLNAFKNQRSTFWLESGGRLRSDEAEDKGWGWIDVNSLTVDGTERIEDFEHIQPDDDNEHDETVARLPLEQPLMPGESITIDFEFEAKLPKVFARTGYYEDYFLVGQWFPKIGVWETGGMRGREAAGWNCHQFHAHSEFYADFGRYHVTFTVPSEFVVGATGVRQSRTDNGDTTTYVYEQDRVIDFAWAASPRFHREERMFVADEWVTEEEQLEVMALHGISTDEATLPDVKMVLLLQPENNRMKDRYFKAVGNAIKYFGLWYGPYPYETITVVDPAYGAGGSGGMEYPTFITGWTDRFAPEDATGIAPLGVEGPELVTIHEFGHQYWQSMVGSNEFEEPWLDEGINSYTTGLVMEAAYGPSGIYYNLNELPIPLHSLFELDRVMQEEVMRLGHIINRDTDQIVRKAWRFQDSMSFGVNSYLKSENALRQLGNEIGEDAMARVMRAYFQRWQFRHPATEDFVAVAEDVSGRELDWFFEEVFRSPEHLDYFVASVSSQRIDLAAGVLDGDGERRTVTRDDIEQKQKEQDGDDDFEADLQLHRSRVVVENNGDINYPVTVKITFADGEEVLERWDGGYRWVDFIYDDRPKVTKVEIDPDGDLVIDVNKTNDSHLEDGERLSLWRWAMKYTIWIQHALQSVAGFVS